MSIEVVPKAAARTGDIDWPSRRTFHSLAPKAGEQGIDAVWILSTADLERIGENKHVNSREGNSVAWQAAPASTDLANAHRQQVAGT